MNSFWAVFKRELKSYFTTPLAYVFLVIFLSFSGYLAFKQGFFEMRQADMRAFFMNLPLLFVFMVPSTAMRLWAEERKIGSIELLFSLPITVTQAVLGKFLAAWAFLGIALILTFPMPITVCYLGNPDIGVILTGYLGSFLMAGVFLAIGCFFSAVSKNQVIAFVLSVVACGILLFAGMPSTMNYLFSFLSVGMGDMDLKSWLFVARGLVQTNSLAYFVLLILAWITTFLFVLPCTGIIVVLFYLLVLLHWSWDEMLWLLSMMEGMSMQIHFDSMQKGLLQLKDLAYFIVLIVGWIAASVVVLDERKAK
jgi:ABC-2 type transport system permease protein